MRAERSKYPRLTTRLPPHVHARLHAASTVLGVPVDQLVESALEAKFHRLDESQRELIDRVAASLLHTTELTDEPPPRRPRRSRSR